MKIKLFDFFALGVEPSHAVGALPAFANTLLPAQANNAGRVLVTDGVNAYWGTPSGVAAIGSAITGGVANCVLFVDGSGNLGQDSAFTYNANDGQGALIGDRTLAAKAVQMYPSGFFSQESNPLEYVDLSSGGGGFPYLHLSGVAHDSAIEFQLAGVRACGLIYDHAADTFDVVAADGNYSATFAQDHSVTLPKLAGTGTRAVMADANGKLSAP